MADRPLRSRPTQRVVLYLVLGVGLALIGLSLVVDAPAAQAAPDIFAGLVFCSIPYLLVEHYGLDDVMILVAAGVLAIGGLGVVYEGLTALELVRPIEGIVLLSDLAILAGLVLVLVHRFLV